MRCPRDKTSSSSISRTKGGLVPTGEDVFKDRRSGENSKRAKPKA